MRSSILLCLLLALFVGCSENSPDPKPDEGGDEAATSAVETKSDKVVKTKSDADSKSDRETITALDPKFEFNNAIFEAPTIVEFGGDKNFKHTLYPSPAVFDVDNDGDNELVLGDLFGKLVFSENENDGDGDPVWSKPTPVKYYDGKAINMSN